MARIDAGVPIRAAESGEQRAAAQLLFQHLPSSEREAAAARAEAMLASGELDPAGLLVAVRGERVIGAILASLAPGRVGLVWPPQTLEYEPAIEDALVTAAKMRFQAQGIPTGQALLRSEEAFLGQALQRNGFPLITTLWFLRHTLQLDLRERPHFESLRLVSLADEPEAGWLETTLLQTYEGTLDCPELNGVRDAADILAGHRAEGRYDPRLWWRAWIADEPAGLLLVNPALEGDAWEIAYMGVLPHQRRRGLGRQLVHKALEEARRAGVQAVTLCVDQRNSFARRLYESAGFEPFDARDVYLGIFPPRQLRSS